MNERRPASALANLLSSLFAEPAAEEPPARPWLRDLDVTGRAASDSRKSDRWGRIQLQSKAPQP